MMQIRGGARIALKTNRINRATLITKFIIYIFSVVKDQSKQTVVTRQSYYALIEIDSYSLFKITYQRTMVSTM